MTTLRFDLDAHSLEFEHGSSYPTGLTTKIFGVADRTADGSLQYESLGITIETRVLQFDRMNKADYDALRYWFTTVAQGSKNSFQLTDEYGLVFDVVITNQQIDFTEIFLDTFQGSLTVEVLP